MKLLIFPLMIILLFLIAGCKRGTGVREFIPGTYVTEWDNGFSSVRDTMLLEPATAGGSEGYLISRRTSYTQLIKSGTNKPRYKIARWTGSFDTKTKTVVVDKNGRVLTFDPAKNEMRMGSAIYKKL